MYPKQHDPAPRPSLAAVERPGKTTGAAKRQKPPQCHELPPIVHAATFFLVGVMWVGHHGALARVDKITHRALLFNLLILFWVTLLPFAAEAPPSPTDVLRLLKTQGEPSTIQVIDNLRSKAPPNSDVIDWARLNNLGYDLIAEDRKQDAVALLKLTASLFPTSADAADSLGDAYRVAGDVARARQTYQHAIDLVAADSHYPTADTKKDFIQGELAKVKSGEAR
jgi:tetratricopeptide (TPR) repeat protein